MMRVAVPTDDQTTISAHTGRCAGFAIYTIENKAARKEAYRENTAGHAHHQHDEGHGEHHHDHSGMIGLLRDCEYVVTGGMGPRLINDLEAEGINIIFTYEQDVAKAVEALAEGRLVRDQPRTRCHRH
jgi:predicted Fe-Mo cluster-binding NifX family protein